MTFEALIAQIDELAETQRDRGTYFEYLVRAYLKNEPTYKNEFIEVWMLADVPDSYGIPKIDIDLDLVAKKHTGELDAIQAKFYNHSNQKSDIDSFLGELGQ
ncbi:restriction endonuclease [Streptococcus gordonii]|uniref:restriction endonuclease n=1 Tax=Streptococcus gordonii TaxID=1302 RepID=UPI0022E14D94|nr:restriction endonuclease [Streptococcus gordonii]